MQHMWYGEMISFSLYVLIAGIVAFKIVIQFNECIYVSASKCHWLSMDRIHQYICIYLLKFLSSHPWQCECLIETQKDLLGMIKTTFSMSISMLNIFEHIYGMSYTIECIK